MNYIQKRKLRKIFAWIFVILVLFVAGSMLPIEKNYKLMTVMSGSMEPKILTGSLAFVLPRSDYRIGNIITFKSTERINGSSITSHRIVEIKTNDGRKIFVTKGDANENKDTDEIAQSQIIGRLFFAIPFLGYPIAFAKTLPGLILLVIVPSTIVIYEEIRKIYFELKFDLTKRKLKTWYS
jgi:signal peptidase